MIKISEVKCNNEVYYLKEYESSKSENSYNEKVDIVKITLSKDNFKYIFLYDENKEVIRDTHNYLNNELELLAFNSRDITATALKLLYSFIKLVNLDMNKLEYREINMLKEFLYGYSRSGKNYTFELSTLRGSSTVNKYLSIYRNYLNYLDIENEVFNETRVIGTEKGRIGLLGHTVKNTFQKYTINDATNVGNNIVPRYIKESEYNQILDIVQGEYNLREEIIVRLMFENGLRIGEVLGLTLEDIDETKIFIRNRVSDKSYQKAKTCFRPKSTNDYKHSTYDTFKIGYQIIKPKLEVMDKIYEYIDIAHGQMSKTNRANYIEGSVADKVSESEMLEGNNYYLFLNKNGKSLGISGWNKILRKIFSEIGLVMDKGVKTHNLNHRFRHGFAMKRVRGGASAVEIASDLRHNSLSSVMCYFRPTEEDIYDANTFGAENMLKRIPSLVPDIDEEGN